MLYSLSPFLLKETAEIRGYFLLIAGVCKLLALIGDELVRSKQGRIKMRTHLLQEGKATISKAWQVYVESIILIMACGQIYILRCSCNAATR